ncbi:MAG: SDR family NAD(P)-dependent oxidoreductase, partial [Aquabacterium sp.]|uniref:SDR family NAD(P)-dependent oxidoreductase n=1 Tax=Aquabacterium sp. TaxID=1872578 RepID=UPI00120C8379
NSGIGLSMAHELARQGAIVCLACRDQGKATAARNEILQRTPGAQVELYKLDLSSFAAIHAFVQAFAQRHDRLDALINNAGAVPMRQQFTQEGFELQFGGNYLGPFLLTHLLMPLLQVTADEGGIGRGDARIVHLSSIAHNLGRIDLDTAKGRKPYRVLPAYAQSKLGNLMFSHALARKLPAGITSQAMHPGGVASPIYRELPRWQYAVMRPFLIGPERPGKLAAELAIGSNRRGENGGYFSIQHPRIVSSAARDQAMQETLYKQSCLWAEVSPLSARGTIRRAA